MLFGGDAGLQFLFPLLAADAVSDHVPGDQRTDVAAAGIAQCRNIEVEHFRSEFHLLTTGQAVGAGQRLPGPLRRGREDVERFPHDCLNRTGQEALELPQRVLRGGIHVGDPAAGVCLQQPHRGVAHHFGELLLGLLVAGEATGDEIGRQRDAGCGQPKEDKSEPAQSVGR